MVIFYGTRLLGQADVVESGYWVATEFFHIFYAPVLPIGGRLVCDHTVGEGADGSAEPGSDEADPVEAEDETVIPIPMSGKSVLLGYLRGWGFWLAIFCGFLGGMLWLMSGDDAEAAGMYPGFLWVAIAGFVLAMASYYGPWNTASPERAKQLLEAAGLAPSGDAPESPDEL